MSKLLVAITQDISGFWMRYSAQALVAAFVATLCYVSWFLFYKKKKIRELRAVRGNLLGFFLLAFYLYMVLGITILSRTERPTRELSFELFRTFRNTFFAKKQVYENIIMFVPFSMILYWLMPIFKKSWAVLFLGIGSSLMIEITQWVTMTGCFEVDDILTNTIGMMLGYLICLIIELKY